MRGRELTDPDHLPARDARYARYARKRLTTGPGQSQWHQPRILLLYGSLRRRSYSRLVIEEAARLVQVCGGSQSFNAVNTLRLLGRWMRMFTIPNQSSVAKAFQEFDDSGRMRPSSYYDRIVDVIEELIRFTVLLRPHVAALTDRYSERKDAASGARDSATDLSSTATAHRRAGAAR